MFFFFTSLHKWLNVIIFHVYDFIQQYQCFELKYYFYRIIDSKAPGFPKGALVCAHVGWRTRTVLDVNKPLNFGTKVEVIEEVPGLSPSLWLGALGMPG